MAGSDFQGARDLRVLKRAKTLWVAVWLHCLDMAATGDGEASYSLEVTQHGRGPLVEFLLFPQASSLTFEEVIDQVLVENWYKIESLLDNIRQLWAQLQRELNDLSWACEDELEKSAQKKMKRDMEQRRRDLKGLKATISQYESSLRGAQVQPEGTQAHEDDASNSEAEGAMATTPVADDTPAVSPSPESLTSPPGKEQTRSMEVDDRDDSQPPASPVSHREDELLTGGGAVGVKGGWPTSRSHLLGAVMAVTRVPFRRSFPSAWPPLTYLCEALLANASRTSTKKGPEPLHWKS